MLHPNTGGAFLCLPRLYWGWVLQKLSRRVGPIVFPGYNVNSLIAIKTIIYLIIPISLLIAPRD